MSGYGGPSGFGISNGAMAGGSGMGGTPPINQQVQQGQAIQQAGQGNYGPLQSLYPNIGNPMLGGPNNMSSLPQHGFPNSGPLGVPIDPRMNVPGNPMLGGPNNLSSFGGNNGGMGSMAMSPRSGGKGMMR